MPSERTAAPPKRPLLTQYAKMILTLPISEEISPDQHDLCRDYLALQEEIRSNVTAASAMLGLQYGLTLNEFCEVVSELRPSALRSERAEPPRVEGNDFRRQRMNLPVATTPNRNDVFKTALLDICRPVMERVNGGNPLECFEQTLDAIQKNSSLLAVLFANEKRIGERPQPKTIVTSHVIAPDHGLRDYSGKVEDK